MKTTADVLVGVFVICSSISIFFGICWAQLNRVYIGNRERLDTEAFFTLTGYASIVTFSILSFATGLDVFNNVLNATEQILVSASIIALGNLAGIYKHIRTKKQLSKDDQLAQYVTYTLVSSWFFTICFAWYGYFNNLN